MKYMTAEPYKIKVVEHIGKTTKSERQTYLKEADYNVFKLKSDAVYIDCLTDSGTSAMSADQWSAMMLGDESYAGCSSFYKLQQSVQEVFNMPFLQPTHQGRAADYFVSQIYGKKSKYTFSNMHFITYLGHANVQGTIPIDIPVDEAFDSNAMACAFKGNIDIGRLKQLIEEKGADNITAVIISLTCNNNGGQPMSMENLKAVHTLTESNRIPIVLDCARIAENAYFIKQRESGYENKTIKQITQELCSYCETAIMSAKKDALVNIGGLFITRNQDVFAKANQLALAFEGYITYGGLAGRDLEAIAVGLLEGCDEVYLGHRIAQVNYLGNRLKEKGIPIVEPVGGHGVYVNSVEFFPHIPGHQNPSQRLVTALYEEAGVRAVAMTMSITDYSVRSETPFELDCMRIAIPRRAYTNNHLDVIANALSDIYQDRHMYKGMKRVDSDWNSALSLFTSKFELL